MLVGGGDQGGEQSRIVADLRMPQHADRERRACNLDRLDAAVVGPAHGTQRLGQRGHALVVVGVDRHRRVEDAAHPAARLQADGMRRVGGWRRTVAVVTDHVGQVLVQGAAADHRQ